MKNYFVPTSRFSECSVLSYIRYDQPCLYLYDPSQFTIIEKIINSRSVFHYFPFGRNRGITEESDVTLTRDGNLRDNYVSAQPNQFIFERSPT